MICANCQQERSPKKMILPIKNHYGETIGYVCKKCCVKGVAKVQREEKQLNAKSKFNTFSTK